MRAITLLTQVIAITALTSQVHAGTLAHWRFEEGSAGGTASGSGSVLDSAGSNHGTAFGGPVYSSDVPVSPLPSNLLSLDLDGTGDYVAIPDPTGALNGTGGLTVEAWLKAEAGAQSDSQSLIVDHSHGWTDSTGWALQSNPGHLTIAFVVGNGTSFPFATTTTNVFDGEWHHIAGIYDPTATGAEVKIYVNGVLEGTAAGTLVGNSRDVNIGSSWGGGSRRRYLNGQVDEVRISDMALEPTQFMNTVPEPSSFAAIFTLCLTGLVIGRRRRS